ncbi:MAG: hypothetical protein IJQ85_07505 [Selenomonadaceae bacterium]|nr:hypothetical protein [Selenomonadaceae bacterium]
MAIVFGVVGVVVGGAIIHGNHSDYSCHSRHSNYREYGDSALVNAIQNKKDEIDAKEDEVDRLREKMEENFQARVEKLKAERNYSSFNYSDAEDIIDNVKEEMREELDDEIAQDKKELEAIDKMIARINEIELQAKRE